MVGSLRITVTGYTTLILPNTKNRESDLVTKFGTLGIGLFPLQSLQCPFIHAVLVLTCVNQGEHADATPEASANSSGGKLKTQQIVQYAEHPGNLLEANFRCQLLSREAFVTLVQKSPNFSIRILMRMAGPVLSHGCGSERQTNTQPEKSFTQHKCCSVQAQPIYCSIFQLCSLVTVIILQPQILTSSDQYHPVFMKKETRIHTKCGCLQTDSRTILHITTDLSETFSFFVKC